MAGFLFIAGLTGALIAFNDELDAMINPSLLRVAPGSKSRLLPDAWVASVEGALPSARVVYVALPNNPHAAAKLGLEPLGDAELDVNEAFVDPFTARFLGARQWGAFRADPPHLMPFIYKLHYSLHIPGQWGIWLLGVVAIVWLLDCFVGFYLTLPVPRNGRGRAYSASEWWGKWAAAWRIKTTASAYRLNFDVHRASGLWLWPVLALLALTSFALNLNEEVFTPIVSLFGALSEHPLATLAAPETPPQPVLTFSDAVNAARSYLSAANRDLNPAAISLFSGSGLYQVTFNSASLGEGFFLLRREDVLVDAVTGAWRGAQNFSDGTAADKFLALQFPIHSGQILGLPGRVIVCLAGIATAALSGTGLIIWNTKRAARNRR